MSPSSSSSSSSSSSPPPQKYDTTTDEETTTIPAPPTPPPPPPSPSPSSLLPITVCPLSHPSATVEEYITQSALINAHANAHDALNLAFELEKPNSLLSSSTLLPPTDETTITALTHTVRRRLETKLTTSHPHALSDTLFPHAPEDAKGPLATHSVYLIESANFAAIACWTPPSISASQPPLTPADIASLTSSRPLFGEFLTQIETARHKHLYPVSPRVRSGYGYYHLSLLARDPRPGRERVRGAVRAVLEPVLRKAGAEGIPVWMEAGNERARDVYAWFGCRVVETVVVAGVATWCMIRLPEGSTREM